MRALIAALIFTLAVAVTASVFAIWPVVADVPWEDEPVVVQPVDRIAEIRCEGALRLRETWVERGAGPGASVYQGAEREIARYC